MWYGHRDTRWTERAAPIVAACLIAVFAFIAPAAAEYRSCNAMYVIRLSDGSGEMVASPAFSARAAVVVGPPLTNIFGIEYNAAREHARGMIEACAADHWMDRASGSAPARCTENDGPGRGGMHGYPFGSLRNGVSTLICSANPGHTRLVVDVEVHVDGNTGCIPPPNRWAIEVGRGWSIDCPGRATIAPLPEFRPVVPETEDFLPPEDRKSRAGAFLPGIRMPGHDIRTDWVGDDGWQRCEDMCAATPGCNAWTWRRPGTSGPGSQAACLLKSRALVRVPDPCCHSGLME